MLTQQDVPASTSFWTKPGCFACANDISSFLDIDVKLHPNATVISATDQLCICY
jgi:hypothetical protein